MKDGSNVLLPLISLLLTALAPAQEPRLVRARVERRSAAQGLETTVHALLTGQAKPFWIGYAEPVVPGRHEICCHNGHGGYDNGCGRCGLEGKDSFNMNSDDGEPVELESLAAFFVLFRAENHKVGKIRAFSEDCELDVGGLDFYWLTDVRPEESMRWLASFVGGREEEGSDFSERLTDGAITAIALEAGGEADAALERFASPGPALRVREKAAFWLGEARGPRGFQVLRRLVHDDPNPEFRQKAVFALYISKVPEAVDVLIAVARHDSSGSVRGQALFWLAQKAGEKAAGAITDAIENDPETEVKKHAVFALSQLPKDQGVPLLIHVARTNRNSAVRKQAVFWLGQSTDDRALSFFEEILTRP